MCTRLRLNSAENHRIPAALQLLRVLGLVFLSFLAAPLAPAEGRKKHVAPKVLPVSCDAGDGNLKVRVHNDRNESEIMAHTRAKCQKQREQDLLKRSKAKRRVTVILNTTKWMCTVSTAAKIRAKTRSAFL